MGILRVAFLIHTGGQSADAADDLFATEFLQIISGATGAVVRLAVVAECPDPIRQRRSASSEAVKPWGDADKAITASATKRMRLREPELKRSESEQRSIDFGSLPPITKVIQPQLFPLELLAFPSSLS
jgi:hypothetical protein